MNQVTRKLEFDAGHRLIGHEGKCRHLHGHRYVAEITCRADDLDGVGRVIDFSVIKEKVGGWIDEYWDHNTLLNRRDFLIDHIKTSQPDKHPFEMSENPTAENMASFLFYTAEDLLRDYPIKVVSVRLWETPNCYAHYEPGE